MKVADNAAGRRVRCGDCAAALRVPAPKKRPAPSSGDSDGDRPEERFEPRTKPVQGDMDMTPMVDVTFLLLVFFMVTAAFSVQRSIEVPPTEEQEAAPSMQVEDVEDDSIIVRIDNDNTYWVQSPQWDKEQIVNSKQEMLAQVRRAKEEAGESGPKELLVMASGDATHDRVIAALDAGSAVNMLVRLATMEDDDF